VEDDCIWFAIFVVFSFVVLLLALSWARSGVEPHTRMLCDHLTCQVPERPVRLGPGTYAVPSLVCTVQCWVQELVKGTEHDTPDKQSWADASSRVEIHLKESAIVEAPS
jgi:hypothetical protein